jgi:hypothetical protein
MAASIMDWVLGPRKLGARPRPTLCGLQRSGAGDETEAQSMAIGAA